MSRTVRDAKLETRTARQQLKPSGKPYYRAIDPGLHLGYRKGKTGGKWVVRRYVGDQQYEVVTLDGVADDFGDANGESILSFGQAQAKAREFVNKKLAPKGPMTVKQACEAYIDYLDAEKKTGEDAKGRLAKHIYPVIGECIVAEITTKEIRDCRDKMIRHEDDDPDVERKSKDSANRVMSSLKAALNRAFEDEANNIPSDAAWRRVTPFKDVGRARQVHLDTAKSMRLINATSGAFRRLVTAALLTGARPPHELVDRHVRDFSAITKTLTVVDGKTGARDITLTDEAVDFFIGITAGRNPDDWLLPKDDGSTWGKNHHIRPMKDAVERAELSAETTIYALRHTYASQSILANMNLKLLAENMGTSIRMLELHYGKFIASSRQKLVEESSFKLGLVKGNVTPMVPA